MPEEIEYDAYDADAVHVLAVAADGAPLGTGRLLYGRGRRGKTGGDPRSGSLGRLAVTQAARGLGVGAALVRAIEDAARAAWAWRPWTCTRRRMRSASTSGSDTWRTARSSRTRASRTGRCAAPL